MNKNKLILLLVVITLVGSFFYFDIAHYFSLDFIKSRQAEINAYYQQNPWQSMLIYFIAYIIITGLSLPGAAVTTMAGAAIFGLWTGTLLVSFASTIGATLAFLMSRYLFQETVQSKFGHHLTAMNEGIEKDGSFYLFTLRLVPIFPFFMINLLMGLTRIPTIKFYLVSQIGMLAGTMVYVNAGTQLAKIESLSGILSAKIILSFALLGIFPLIAKKIVDYLKAHKVLRRFKKPARFDCNVIVIGAGSGGLVAALIAAAVKAKVTLIEKDKMGGDCLNTGCVPSKALIRTARYVHLQKRAQDFGMHKAAVEFDFAAVMARVQRVIKQIEPHDSVERFTGLGVDCIQGEARIESPWEVKVGNKQLTTRNIIIATGARPFVPPIDGIESIDYLTSDNLWELKQLPQRLLVLGGGPIGCELTQAFARLGSKVSQVEMLDRLLIREDPEISRQLQQTFSSEGIDVKTGYRATEFFRRGDAQFLRCTSDQGDIDIGFDQVLIAVGRAANVSGFGLEDLEIEKRGNHTVAVNDFLQTNYPNIFACGDVTGPYQFTHTASHQAWFATVNALFGRFWKFRVDYSVVPWVTFTDPEIARVGLNELEAKEKNIPYEVTTYDIGDLDRAICEGADDGLVKVLTVPGKDRILGVTIVAEHAGELLPEFVLAMKHKLGLNKILGTIHAYPTLNEANKFAAGCWKKAHAPQGLLKWVQAFHRRQL